MSHHLQAGQVFLPPQEALVLRSHGGKQVVRVHDDVHERVQQPEERAVAACGRTNAGVMRTLGADTISRERRRRRRANGRTYRA